MEDSPQVVQAQNASCTDSTTPPNRPDRLEIAGSGAKISGADGSNVVLTLEIATLFSADLLPFHTQIVLEINRIGNVPAIQSTGHRRIHIPIRAFAMRGETL